MAKACLDLRAIEASLRAVQGDFERINDTLSTPRDPLGDEVVTNMLAGYEYVAYLLEAGIDPLARGNSRHLLQLNHLVLCGAGNGTRDVLLPHLRQTEEHFYDDRSPGGIRALMGFLAEHKGESVWERAADVYIRIVSEPQLFLEGNHRTGALVMSHILCEAGKPPFVLTVANARAYLDPSAAIKGQRKRTVRALLERPRLRRRLAAVLRDIADGPPTASSCSAAARP